VNNFNYNILVIGLGSMGKRRIRNLRAIGFENIFGFDNRPDRIEEAKKLYGIIPVDDINKATNINVFIISVPPDRHHLYINKAIENNIHFFVEASVVDDGMKEIISKLKNRNIIAAPSGTLYFHPAIKKIFSIVQSGELGNITNFIYHSGQYLPDWHTYENVKDYYVSKKETGGAREIVPFELTWITKLLGFPLQVAGFVRKTIEIKGAENIDDTYNVLLNYERFIVNLVIDVVSRCATRKLLINGSEKQLVWNWDEDCVKIYEPLTEKWTVWDYVVNSSAAGYNKNITEQMYIDELLNFFNAVERKADFFNSMEYDHKVLKLLYTIENSSEKNGFQSFDA
jgi:predicted dehydrogenase